MRRTPSYHSRESRNDILLIYLPSGPLGFPGGTSDKESSCQCRRCRRCGFDPWVGRSPGEGNGNPLQYSCWDNSMDRGAWQGYSPWGCKGSDMTERDSLHLWDLVPWPGWYTHSLHWKLKILTTGLPGKSNNILFLKLVNRDFPGGPVVRNLPSNAGDAGSIPDQGTKIPHLSPQLSPGPTTKEDPAQPKLIN